MPSHAPSQAWQVMQALAGRSVAKLGQGQQQLQSHLVQKALLQPQQRFQCFEQQLRQCSAANASQHQALQQVVPHPRHNSGSISSSDISSSTGLLPLQSSRICNCRSSKTYEVTSCDSNKSTPWFHSSSGRLLHESWGSSSSWSSSSWSHTSSRSNRAYSSRGVAATAPQILEELSRLREGDDSQGSLTPAAVVERLNKVIIGQEDAKRAVAIAFRNRWRRQRVTDPEMRKEITPKNLLLIGPTGCGKTEIARRLAKLAEAPFIKVEATKFTEVGYHGRDVDQIVRDLVETSIGLVKKRCKKAAAKMIADAVEQTIIAALLGPGATPEQETEARRKYREGLLDKEKVSIDVPQQRNQGDGPGFVVQGGQMSLSVSLAGMMGPGGAGGAGGSERRSLTVSEARDILEDVEAEAMLPPELLAKEAIRVAEQEGIVFIDEIDKIVNPSGAIRHGSDPSAEGVQRDLLPLIEGSVINTKHGPVATDHMLFIASGAFTAAKPSDMMAELQGRLPIRVELRGLTAADFERILTEPECSMIYQQQRLLGCEGVKLELTPEAIRELAALAEQMNKEVENIGARRLHTVLERLVEDISFEAPDKVAEAEKAAAASPSSDSPSDVSGQASSSSGSGSSGSSKPGKSKKGKSSEATDDDVERLKQQLQSLDYGTRLQIYEDEEMYAYTHVVDKQQVREKLHSLLQQEDLNKYIL